MLSADMAICVKILREGKLKEVLDAGVGEEQLFDNGKTVFAFILWHFRKYGKIPEASTVEEDLKVAVPVAADAPEPVQYYTDKVRKRHLENVVKEGIKNSLTKMEAIDARGAVDAAKEMLREVNRCDLLGERVTNIVEQGQERWAAYEKVKATQEGLDGFLTPFPFLNSYTQGIHPGELWVVVGRLGSGKSWWLVLLMKHLWLSGQSPLFISMEMTKDKIGRRFDALYAALPYRELKRGMLGTHLEEQYKQALASLPGKAPLWVVTRRRVKTVTDVDLLIEELRPSVVLIDGFYKMRVAGGGRYKSLWENVSEVADALQELALVKNIGVVGTTQLNRKVGKKTTEVGTEHISYADTIGQNADVVLALTQTRDMRDNNQMLQQLLKNREDETVSWLTNWDLNKIDFTEISEWEEQEEEEKDRKDGAADWE